MLWSGGILTSTRICQAGYLQSDLCPFCLQVPETPEHALWQCGKFSSSRRWFFEKYPDLDINTLPIATKMTGIILDDSRLDQYFAEVATPDANELRESDPPAADSQDELSVDSEGFAIVAGDGSVPDGQTDFRLRRGGSGLYCGQRHSHNSTITL